MYAHAHTHANTHTHTHTHTQYDVATRKKSTKKKPDRKTKEHTQKKNQIESLFTDEATLRSQLHQRQLDPSAIKKKCNKKKVNGVCVSVYVCKCVCVCDFINADWTQAQKKK